MTDRPPRKAAFLRHLVPRFLRSFVREAKELRLRLIWGDEHHR